MSKTFKSALHAALAIACFGILAFPQAASAHAIVEETQPGIDEIVPESPERVLIRFNEPVEVAFGAIRVFDTNGDRVDVGSADHVEGRADEVQVALKPNLPKGTYTVAWRVVSADGHAITEAFVFHVKERGARAPQLPPFFDSGRPFESALFGLARWLNFSALIVLAGGGIFAFNVWRKSPIGSDEAEQRFAARWTTIARGAWIAAAIATVAGFVLQGSVAGGYSLGGALSPTVLGEVASTRYGKVAIAKIVLLGLLALWWFLIGDRTMRSDTASVGAAGTRRRLPLWAAVSGGAILIALISTPGLAGHAGTTSPIAVNIATDTAHVGAAAAWIGGLVLLVFAAFPAVRTVGDEEPAARLGSVVTRFSDLAVISIVVLVVSGVYRGWVEVGALRALTAATYGWVLLAKVAVFIPALVLGVINNRTLKPRIEAAVAPGATGALEKLRRLVGAEVALGAVVLVLTAVLVSLAPARTEAGVSGPFTTQVALNEDKLDIIVTPNKVGENEVHLTATTATGSPTVIKQMTVLFRKPDQGIGPIVADGKKLAAGHYVVQGNQLSVPGRWEIEVVARINRFDEERATFVVEVNG
ncbi:MAG: copper transport protein [Actinomycetota bacterium]|jgi:copper transport protein|nr:copper transport protein [Actinomycetota bacterium]